MVNSIYSISDETDFFQLAKECSRLLNNFETEKLGREITIAVLDNWEKIGPDLQLMWGSIIEAAGFYPYLEKLKENIANIDTPARNKKTYFKKYIMGKI